MIRDCDICQRCKHENVPYPGLLEPLPIPKGACQSIHIDFIEGLPPSEGKNTILMVVDRLTKYSHFLTLTHPYTALSVAHVFLSNIYKLHGLPENIISDSDAVFTSQLWRELFKLLGIELKMSSSYYPQTDGQTERVNQCINTYLRCMTFENPKKWNR